MSRGAGMVCALLFPVYWHQHRALDAAASSQPTYGGDNVLTTNPSESETTRRLPALRPRPSFPCSWGKGVVDVPGILLGIRRPQGNDRVAPVLLSTVGGSVACATSPHSASHDRRPEHAKRCACAQEKQAAQPAMLVGRDQLEEICHPVVHWPRSTTSRDVCHFSLPPHQRHQVRHRTASTTAPLASLSEHPTRVLSESANVPLIPAGVSNGGSMKTRKRLLLCKKSFRRASGISFQGMPALSAVGTAPRMCLEAPL